MPLNLIVRDLNISNRADFYTEATMIASLLKNIFISNPVILIQGKFGYIRI